MVPKPAMRGTVPNKNAVPRNKAMTSDARIHANRRNALRSTGPRTAAGLADAPGGLAVGPEVGQAVVLAAGGALGWPWDPDPWAPILAGCGLTPTCVWGRAWTAGELRVVLARAAEGAGRDPGALLTA